MRKTLFLLAAIPAGYLPVAYLWLVGHVAFCAFSHSDITPVEGSVFWLAGQAAIYATFIQWPFYFAWSLFSPELSRRQRIGWAVVIFLLNMFAIPYFLWCKYTDSAQVGLLRLVGRARLREYLAR
jgi:hypothetical protein